MVDLHFPAVAWVLMIITLLMMGFLLDGVNMLATHSLAQGATDAAADAGANQRQLSIGSGDIHEFVGSPNERTRGKGSEP